MKPFHWYADAFKNYSNFSGSLSRAGYWWFFVIHLAVIFCLSLLTGRYGVMVYSWFSLLPFLAAGARRLRSVGLSRLFLLLYFVPIAGGVCLMIMYALSEKPKWNLKGVVRYFDKVTDDSKTVGFMVDPETGEAIQTAEEIKKNIQHYRENPAAFCEMLKGSPLTELQKEFIKNLDMLPKEMPQPLTKQKR